MPTVHSSLGARGAASAASAVGVAPGGGGIDGAVLHDFLIEMTTGRPWRPAPSTHRRRPPVVTSGLPLVPPMTAALGAENLAGSSAAADADARRFSSRSAAARRVRRKAKSFIDNLSEDFAFLKGPAPAPPDSVLVNPATTTTSTPSSTERQPAEGPPQVAESGGAWNSAKGAPEVGVAPLRGPEYLNKRGRKELKRQLEAQMLKESNSILGVKHPMEKPSNCSLLFPTGTVVFPTGTVVKAKSSTQNLTPPSGNVVKAKPSTRGSSPSESDYLTSSPPTWDGFNSQPIQGALELEVAPLQGPEQLMKRGREEYTPMPKAHQAPVKSRQGACLKGNPHLDVDTALSAQEVAMPAGPRSLYQKPLELPNPLLPVASEDTKSPPSPELGLANTTPSLLPEASEDTKSLPGLGAGLANPTLSRAASYGGQ